jgi:DNA-damage-inducible protein J
MAADTVVRARVDGRVKDKAAAALAEMGLSVSDAIRMLLVRVAAEKALPFEARVPNAETVAAMEEARSGKLPSFGTAEELMADLNAPDRADDGLPARSRAGEAGGGTEDSTRSWPTPSGCWRRTRPRRATGIMPRPAIGSASGDATSGPACC